MPGQIDPSFSFSVGRRSSSNGRGNCSNTVAEKHHFEEEEEGLFLLLPSSCSLEDAFFSGRRKKNGGKEEEEGGKRKASFLPDPKRLFFSNVAGGGDFKSLARLFGGKEEPKPPLHRLANVNDTTTTEHKKGEVEKKKFSVGSSIGSIVVPFIQYVQQKT